MKDSSVNAAEIRETARTMAAIIALDPEHNIYAIPDLDSGANGAFNEATYNDAFYQMPDLIAAMLPRLYTKSTDVLRSAFEEIGPWAAYEVMGKFQDVMRYENLALAVAGCAYPEASREDLRGVLQELWERDQARSSDDFIFSSHGAEVFRFFTQERFRAECLGDELSWDVLRPSLNQGAVQVLFSKEHLASTFFPDWSGDRDELSVSRENLAYARTAEKIMEILEGEIRAGHATTADTAGQAAALTLSLILVHQIFPDHGKFHVTQISQKISVEDFLSFKIGDAAKVSEMYRQDGHIQKAGEVESAGVLLESMKEKLPAIEKAPWLANPYAYFMVFQQAQGIKKVREILGVNTSPLPCGHKPGSPAP